MHPFSCTEIGNRCQHKSFSKVLVDVIPYSDRLRSSSRYVNHHQIISEFAFERGLSIPSRYTWANLSPGNRNLMKGNLKWNIWQGWHFSPNSNTFISPGPFLLWQINWLVVHITGWYCPCIYVNALSSRACKTQIYLPHQMFYNTKSS